MRTEMPNLARHRVRWVTGVGDGFDLAPVKHGNGLDHSVRRMEGVGGFCVVESQPGVGTRVRLSVLLPATEGQT